MFPLLKARAPCLPQSSISPKKLIFVSGKDICACAATGTGKTAAYMLPILERLLYKAGGERITRVLVLVPTRELGAQVRCNRQEA